MEVRDNWDNRTRSRADVGRLLVVRLHPSRFFPDKGLNSTVSEAFLIGEDEIFFSFKPAWMSRVPEWMINVAVIVSK